MYPNRKGNALGLPKYEIPSSILHIPASHNKKSIVKEENNMVLSKSSDEYDYVLVIKGIESKLEIMRRLDNAKLKVDSEQHRIGDLYLIRIRSDDELLEEWAERMHLLMRLDGSGVYEKFERSLKCTFQITTFFPYYSVFRSSERQLVIHEILHKKSWENGAELNESICSNIVYMYPLHINDRKNELYWKWKHGYNKWEDSNNGHWFLIGLLWPTQPLSDVVEYFGEEVGFYFALIEYVIKWLYIPTIAGTIIFFVQLVTFESRDILHLQLQTAESILPYFSLFMVIWTSTFIQFWKRRQIELAHKWGVLNYEEKDDKTRLSHKQEAEDSINRDLISNNLRIRACKLLLTTPCIILMVISCVVFMFWFLAMRSKLDSENGHFLISYVLHTLLWGLIVPIFSGLHIKICQYLNDWENWRTESDHYKYYTAKVCSLLLINTFVAMYYLCCFERSLSAVAFQVASFMIARLFLDVFGSIVIMPYLRKYKIKQVIRDNVGCEYDPSSIHDIGVKEYEKNIKIVDMTGDYARIKQSAAWHQALSPQYDSFKNYCFLILFFGYVSNFSVAFCLAPLVALIGMLFKLRSDRFHLCCNTQRPLPRRVSGIGIWLTVLDQMCTFAIITNVLIIYFTTNIWKDNVSTLIIFEHLLLSIRFGLKVMIPEMPLHVKADIRIHQLTRSMRRKKLWRSKQKSSNRYNKNNAQHKSIYIEDIANAMF